MTPMAEGEVIVVAAERLQDHTLNGWVLIAITTEDVIRYETVKDQYGNTACASDGRPMPQQLFSMRKPCFVLTRAKDDSIAEVVAKYNQLNEQLHHARGHANKMQEERAQLTHKVKLLEEQAVRDKEVHDRAMKDLGTMMLEKHVKERTLLIDSFATMTEQERRVFESIARLGDHQAVIDWLGQWDRRRAAAGG